MNQDKFGKLIKEIRKKHNLTQKDLADKYNVTYQAVSKWENGKNMPDTFLIKQISKDFNISMEDLFDGKLNNKKKNVVLGIIILMITFIIILLILLFQNNDNFIFKTLSSDCDNFNLSGNISYNDKKTSIYITNIKYCGKSKLEDYISIECNLYESNKNVEKKISSYKYEEQEKITLDKFLQDLTFTVDDYKQSCKEYKENSLYLLISAKNDKKEFTTFKIPLTLNENCN